MVATDVELTPKQILSSLEDLTMELSKTSVLRDVMLKEIDDNLNALYSKLPDKSAEQEAVVKVFNRINALNQAAETAIERAELTTAFAGELYDLLNSLAQEHNELYEAVDNDDRRHPLVAGLTAKVHEEGFTAGEQYGSSEAMSHEIVEHLGAMLHWTDDSPEAIGKFMKIFFGEIELNAMQIDGFFDWLASIGDE